MGQATPATLAGKRILIAEDEPILAMLLEDLLTDLGCVVVGPALRLRDAEEMAREEELDGALLDVNMGDGRTFEVARILAERGIPFCFSTGYGAAGIEPAFCDALVLQKPYRQADLATALGSLPMA
ncbi:MAG TPA: response regulator [Allosphingosinicella sp.]|nr:response regulator [Allosphingosinicella sp.]